MPVTKGTRPTVAFYVKSQSEKAKQLYASTPRISDTNPEDLALGRPPFVELCLPRAVEIPPRESIQLNFETTAACSRWETVHPAISGMLLVTNMLLIAVLNLAFLANAEKWYQTSGANLDGPDWWEADTWMQIPERLDISWLLVAVAALAVVHRVQSISGGESVLIVAAAVIAIAASTTVHDILGWAISGMFAHISVKNMKRVTHNEGFIMALHPNLKAINLRAADCTPICGNNLTMYVDNVSDEEVELPAGTVAVRLTPGPGADVAGAVYVDDMKCLPMEIAEIFRDRHDNVPPSLEEAEQLAAAQAAEAKKAREIAAAAAKAASEAEEAAAKAAAAVESAKKKKNVKANQPEPEEPEESDTESEPEETTKKPVARLKTKNCKGKK